MFHSLRPHGLQHDRTPPITNSQSLLRLMSIESVIPSNHLILCRPLLLLPSIFPSIRVFSNESILLLGWPKYWSFSFSISPSNEYSGPISFSFIELLKYILLSDRARLPFPQHRTFCLPTILLQEFLIMLLFPFPIAKLGGKVVPVCRRFPNSCGTWPSPTC